MTRLFFRIMYLRTLAIAAKSAADICLEKGDIENRALFIQDERDLRYAAYFAALDLVNRVRP